MTLPNCAVDGDVEADNIASDRWVMNPKVKTCRCCAVIDTDVKDLSSDLPSVSTATEVDWSWRACSSTAALRTILRNSFSAIGVPPIFLTGM